MNISQVAADPCSVCLEEFNDESIKDHGKKIQFSKENEVELRKDCSIQALCNHAFHKDCISSWINKLEQQRAQPSCPLCRQKITVIRFLQQEQQRVQGTTQTQVIADAGLQQLELGLVINLGLLDLSGTAPIADARLERLGYF